MEIIKDAELPVYEGKTYWEQANGLNEYSYRVGIKILNKMHDSKLISTDEFKIAKEKLIEKYTPFLAELL